MAIEQITRQHIFTYVWSDEGSPQGASMVDLTRFEDGGVAIPKTTNLLDARPVALTDATALAQISADINADALADNATKAAQIAALTQDKADAVSAKAAAESARDAALAQVAALQAQLDELQTPVDENGVPKEVTMRQAQLVMLGTPVGNATLLDAVEAAISKMAASGTVEGRAAQITWDKSSTVKRDNALIGQLKTALGLTDAQIDALFVAASKL